MRFVSGIEDNRTDADQEGSREAPEAGSRETREMKNRAHCISKESIASERPSPRAYLPIGEDRCRPVG